MKTADITENGYYWYFPTPEDTEPDIALDHLHIVEAWRMRADEEFTFSVMGVELGYCADDFHGEMVGPIPQPLA